MWGRDAALRVERRSFRDGREWSFQVRECAPGEAPEVQGLSITSLVSGAGGGRIDVLKMDVEGTEQLVFSDGAQEWLPRTGALAVEIHDEAAREAVLRMIREHPFEVGKVRETFFCFRTPGEPRPPAR